jgi:hypothetical protein
MQEPERKKEKLTKGKRVSLLNQKVILLLFRIQPRGLVLSCLPRLGGLFQLSLQHHVGIAGILQRLIQLGLRSGLSSL